MRTTIDLPDKTWRLTKVRAALLGTSFKDLVARYVEDGLRRGVNDVPERRQHRNPLPIAQSVHGEALPPRTNADLYELLLAEETHEADTVHDRDGSA